VLKVGEFMLQNNIYSQESVTENEIDGEYTTIDLNKFEKINYHVDKQKRINVGRQNALKYVKIFINISGDSNTKALYSNNFLMFPSNQYTRLRKVRGKEKGYDIKVNKNGTLWLGERFQRCSFEIYTRRDDKHGTV
jgi:hypothetical protein